MTNEEMKEKLNEFITRVHTLKHTKSLGSEHHQAEEDAFNDEMANEVSTWDITQTEFENLYDQCDRKLTIASDLTGPIAARDGFTVA